MIFCALASHYLRTRLPWIIPWGMNKVFWIDNEIEGTLPLSPLLCPAPPVDWVYCRLTSDWLTHHQQTFICVPVSPAFIRKNKPTPNFPFLSLTLPGWGSSATTGLLVEVLREQGEHCLNYSKTQLPSAPRSKAEDYQQPAVMRPQWLEIAGTAWYTLPQPQHRYERLRWNTLRKTTVI